MTFAVTLSFSSIGQINSFSTLATNLKTGLKKSWIKSPYSQMAKKQKQKKHKTTTTTKNKNPTTLVSKFGNVCFVLWKLKQLLWCVDLESDFLCSFCCIRVLFLWDKSCLQHFYNMNLCPHVLTQLHALKYSAVVCSVHPSVQCQCPEHRDGQVNAELGVKDSIYAREN